MMIKSSKLSLSEPVSPILFWNINILKNSNCLALFQDKLPWNEWALNSVISHEIFSVKSLYSMFIAHKSDSGGWSAHTGIPCAVLCNRVWSWDCKSHTLQHDTREFGWMCVWVNLTIRKNVHMSIGWTSHYWALVVKPDVHWSYMQICIYQIFAKQDHFFRSWAW